MGDAQSDTKASSTPSSDTPERSQARGLFRWLVLVAVCVSLFYACSARLRVASCPESPGKWSPMAIGYAGSKAEAWGSELESAAIAVVSSLPPSIRRMWPSSIKYSSLKSSSRDDDDSFGLLVKPSTSEATSPSRRSSHSDVELSGFEVEAISRSDSEILDDALGSFLASKLYAKRSNIDSLL